MAFNFNAGSTLSLVLAVNDVSEKELAPIAAPGAFDASGVDVEIGAGAGDGSSTKNPACAADEAMMHNAKYE